MNKLTKIIFLLPVMLLRRGLCTGNAAGPLGPAKRCGPAGKGEKASKRIDGRGGGKTKLAAGYGAAAGKGRRAGTKDWQRPGLANTTADMLTKGTKTRTATQIAESMEFLGGSINPSTGWNGSNVTASFTSDKIDKAMAILADVVLNPSFKQEEIDLVKSQALDGLTYNLKQPGFLANYVASRYSFNEHPVDGTPDSIKALTRDDLVGFHKEPVYTRQTRF